MSVVIPELRSLESPDVDNIEAYRPADAACFGLRVTAEVGAVGEEGTDVFDFFVCSPRWLAGEIGEQDVIFGRHYLFMATYSYERLWTVVRDVCRASQAATWDEAATKLGRYLAWEFEDERSFSSKAELLSFLARH